MIYMGMEFRRVDAKTKNGRQQEKPTLFLFHHRMDAFLRIYRVAYALQERQQSAIISSFRWQMVMGTV